MKYIFELNSRTDSKHSAESKHNRIIETLKGMDDVWGIPKSLEIPFPGFGNESFLQIPLDKYFTNKIKFSLFYEYRNRLTDHSLCDDRLYIEFKSTKIDLGHLYKDIFPSYVNMFDAYSAAIFTEKIMFFDFEKTRNKNFRHEIVRFHPVSYYDRELCLRAIKMEPEKIERLLKENEIQCSLIASGISICMGYKDYTLEEANEFDLKIRNALFLN